MLEQRKAFRRERKFGEADRIRDRLVERGIVIKDRPDGRVDWARASPSMGTATGAATVVAVGSAAEREDTR
jgi:hypothetical protein